MAKAVVTVAAVSGLATATFVILYQNHSFSWSLSAAITCGTVFYHFVMRLLIGAVVPKLAKEANGW